jgi:GNAT superfamily N-acetyltransferase
LHQELKTREEYDALVAVRDANAAAAAAGSPADARSVCIVAVAPLASFGGEGWDDEGSAGADPAAPSATVPHPALHIGADPVLGGVPAAVVGTLDVAFARALPGEDLVGDAAGCAAYMANVCAAPAARRRGVGARLLAVARGAARAWGADALYVHALAVNEVAARFYGGAGFRVEKEEAPAAAKARGHCLDGVEGLGRAVLYRDDRLWDAEGVAVEELEGVA